MRIAYIASVFVAAAVLAMSTAQSAQAVGLLGRCSPGANDCDAGLECDRFSTPPKCVNTLPDSGVTGIGDVLQTIQRITNVIFGVLIAISIIFILISAFRFVFMGDKPDEVKKAQLSLLYAAIGIGIALLAAGFVPVLRSILLT